MYRRRASNCSRFARLIRLTFFSVRLDLISSRFCLPLFIGPWLSSGPFHQRRQRRQYAFDIAAGFQAEHRAAVVEKIVFDVAAAANELLFALSIRVGHGVV